MRFPKRAVHALTMEAESRTVFRMALAMVSSVIGNLRHFHRKRGSNMERSPCHALGRPWSPRSWRRSELREGPRGTPIRKHARIVG